MYRPPPYVQDDLSVLHAMIRARSFAVVSSIVGGEIGFAYAPMVLDADAGFRGSVRFHLARANPLSKIDGANIRIAFLGPDAYVSPDWYASEGLVPTWNYVAVEASGTAAQLDDSGLLKLLVDLSAEREERLSPKKPWTIDKVPEKKMAALLAAIVGFAVPLDTLEGKFKLSQDKKAEDFAGVVEALSASHEPEDRAVADLMRRFEHK